MGLIFKNKRGIFFTLLVIYLLSLFLVSYTAYVFIKDRQEVSSRIKSLNNFVFSLEQDIQRQIYISTYRSILGLGNYITSEGEFLEDGTSGDAIKDALVSGNDPGGGSISLMDEFRLQDWETRITDFGDKMNLDITYVVGDVLVQQISPWEIEVNVGVDMNINDKSGLVSWNREDYVISSDVGIIGFEDPLYMIDIAEGKIPLKINKSIYEDNFVVGSDVTNLLAHVENSNYIASTSGVSFLERLEGKTTPGVVPNPYGIESLVYRPALSDQGVFTKDKTVVDYIYASTDNPTACNINGMPAWFKLDVAHHVTYQVEDLTPAC